MISRDVLSEEAYLASGIEFVSLKEDLEAALSPDGAGGSMMRGYYEKFLNQKDSEDFEFNGLTQSEPVPGNDISFITDSSQAYKEYLDLINSAVSFIHIQNFVLHSDLYIRPIMDALIDKARAGVRVRIVVNRASTLPSLSDGGWTWLERQDISRLRHEPNIELIFNDPYERRHGDRAAHGIFNLFHRKWLIVDNEEDGVRFLKVFGGDRVLGAVSFSKEETDPTSKESRAPKFVSSIGWHPFRDVSFILTGEVTRQIQDVFLEDFRACGGKLKKELTEEEKARLYPSGNGDTEEDDISLRLVSHNMFEEQNCLNTWLSLLEDPNGGDVTIATSFAPNSDFIAALGKAAEGEKKITWIVGGFWYRRKTQDQVRAIAGLYKAGLDIRIVPYQLHTKIFANEKLLSIGSYKFDDLSIDSHEQLIVMERVEAQAGPLNEYIDALLKEAQFLDEELTNRGLSRDSTLEELIPAIEQLTLPRPANPNSDYREKHTSLGVLLHTLSVWLTASIPSKSDPP